MDAGDHVAKPGSQQPRCRVRTGRRARTSRRGPRGLRLRSFTALKQQFEDISTKAAVLKIRGGPNTRLTLELSSPSKMTQTITLGELAESNETLFTGPFPKESALVHRAVFEENYRTSVNVNDTDDGSEANWYYTRVVQSNGQLAWSSPIWVEKA